MVRLTRRWAALTAAAGLLAACGSGLQIRVEFDPSQDFRRYRAYAWLPEPATRPGLSAPERIRVPLARRVDAELGRHGYRPVADPGDADFLLGWHAATREQLDVRQVHRQGWGRGWGYSESEVFVHRYPVGSLLLDVVDASRTALVWRGEAEAKLAARMSDAELSERIATAVTELLEDFPPPR